MFKTSAGFSKALDRATSNLAMEPDWDAILTICDMLRAGDVAPKPAFESIKKKLQDKNAHTVVYTLQVLDATVKNCGKPVHDEVITMSYMEEFVSVLKKSPEDVRNRILEVLQCWAHGFEGKPQYRCVKDTVDVLKIEGYKFPAMSKNDALFVADSAPDWVDGEVCHRCRDKFGLTTRKHHCRNCGQIFCAKCSSKVSALPKYGIEKEVRVCDPCYDAINGSRSTLASAIKKKEKLTDPENGLPKEYLESDLAKEPQLPAKKTEQEIQEQEELELALAISQSEAEVKNKNMQRKSSWTASAGAASIKQITDKPTEPQHPHTNGNTNPDLDRYLNRQYWENKQKDHVGPVSISAPQEPSAPTPSSTPSTIIATSPVSTGSRIHESYQNGETDEIHQFMSALKSQLNVFTNRMRSNVNRRRPLVNDPTVISMFNALLPMRAQLMEYSQTQDHWKEYYERLQEKLTRLREAREALDLLREEHRDKLRIEAEEKHRIMQAQMIAKLDSLRLKKREYLEIQRQVAFQQMQAQEAEMQRRKQAYQPYAFVPGYAMGASPVNARQQAIPAAAPGYPPSGVQMGHQGYGGMHAYGPVPGQQGYAMPQPQNVPLNYYAGQPPQHFPQQNQPHHGAEYQHPGPPPVPQATYAAAASQPSQYAPVPAYPAVHQQQQPHMGPGQMPMPHSGYQAVPQAYQNIPQQAYYPPQQHQPQQPPPGDQTSSQPPGAVPHVDEGPLISFD